MVFVISICLTFDPADHLKCKWHFYSFGAEGSTIEKCLCKESMETSCLRHFEWFSPTLVIVASENCLQTKHIIKNYKAVEPHLFLENKDIEKLIDALQNRLFAK